MNLKCIFFIYIFSGLNLILIGQNQFMKGYIVKNNHVKVPCFIMNNGKNELSSKYIYKLSNNIIEKIELQDIDEFGVENEFKYIRTLIQKEVSTNQIKNLKDSIPELEWEEGSAFIRVLVEGKYASLYSFSDEGKTLFFFRVGLSSIEPLFYKEYYYEGIPGIDKKTISNNAYIEQLKNNVSCVDSSNVKLIDYTEKKLIKYFVDYNKCKDPYSESFISKRKKSGGLKFKIGASLNYNSLVAQDFQDELKVTFYPEKTIGYGAEIEYVIPSTNYKWSLFGEAYYNSYYSTKSDNTLNDLHNGYIFNLKSFEFPFGVNYNIYLNKDQRFFLKCGFVAHIILDNSYIKFNTDANYPLLPTTNFLIGAGYNFKIIAIEGRVYTDQNITAGNYKRNSRLSQFSLRLSYTLF